MTGKVKEPTVYHICANFPKFVVYAIVNKDTEQPVCTNCETEIPKGIAMVSRLQKLNV